MLALTCKQIGTVQVHGDKQIPQSKLHACDAMHATVAGRTPPCSPRGGVGCDGGQLTASEGPDVADTMLEGAQVLAGQETHPAVDGPADDGPSQEPALGPVTAVEIMMQHLSEPITPAILPRPPATRPSEPRRRRRSPVPNPRQSHRLASSSSAALNAVAKAQRLIMHKLGIESEADDALAKYSRTFDAPLTEQQIDALTALTEARGLKRPLAPGHAAGAAASSTVV